MMLFIDGYVELEVVDVVWCVVVVGELFFMVVFVVIVGQFFFGFDVVQCVEFDLVLFDLQLCVGCVVVVDVVQCVL